MGGGGGDYLFFKNLLLRQGGVSNFWRSEVFVSYTCHLLLSIEKKIK